MNAMLLNAHVLATCRGALATQTPTHLVDGDVHGLLPVRLAAQLESGGEGGNTAPQNGNLFAGDWRTAPEFKHIGHDRLSR